MVLLQGWTIEGKRHDYGYDLVLNTYDYKGDLTFQWGELEAGEVLIQLKATDKLTLIKQGTFISYTISAKHIRLWHKEVTPVILIIYDVIRDTAYWLYTQKYFNTSPFQLNPTQQSINVHIPTSQRVDADAVELLREYKEQTLKNIQQKVTLHV